MSIKSRPFAIAFLSLVVAASTFAEGAGGFLFGLVQPGWNPAFMPSVPATLPDFEYFGGFGYGVTRDGTIIGGFGMALLDFGIADGSTWSSSSTLPAHLAGGVGGVVVGSRVLGGENAHLDIVARLGLGGMALMERTAWQDSGGNSGYWYLPQGYAVAYAEPYIELGVGLTRWMQLAATLGYPVFGNLIPGKPMTELFYFSPTIGATLTFGRYRR